MQIREFLKHIFSGKANSIIHSKLSETTPKSVVRSVLLQRIHKGRLVIPDGLSEIPSGLFDGFACGKENDVNQLVAVVIPGSVKSIGHRAFGSCKNLQEVIIAEGVERIGSNAFSGCEKLKKIRLPASVSIIDGWAFFNSGLVEPVFSADGKTLVYYPQTWKHSEYCLPEGVEEIGSRAFIYAKELTKIVLPQSLKRICSEAFMNCGFSEIAIPKEAVIENKAFAFFKYHIRIIHENQLNALDEKLEYCRSLGIPFLHRQRIKPPQKPYWKEECFMKLARQCASGSVEAMEKMGDYFFSKAENEIDPLFYQCAAQFWRVRAYRYGSETAKRYLLEWSEANPDAHMPSPFLDECLYGSAYGEALNAMGFLFFDPDREYSLSGVDAQGVVEISSWESEEDPDDDGFGREECYDWWYLNEYLTLPEGIGYIHSYSRHDKQCNENKFKVLHDQVAATGGKGQRE